MSIMLTATVASVVGLAAAVFGLLLLSREVWGAQGGFWSRRTFGALSFLGAGCVLAIGGQYKLHRDLYHQSGKTERLASMSVLLQAPLEKLNVQFTGDNPFADPSKSCSLRLRVFTKAGSTFISEIPRGQVKRDEASSEDSPLYRIAWQPVLAGVTNEEGRLVAGRIGYLNDLRKIDRLEAEIVVQATARVPMPESMAINFLDTQELLTFMGNAASEGPVRKEDAWVGVYKDETSLGDKVTTWETIYSSPSIEEKVGKPLGGSLALGIVLLLAGFGFLSAAENPGPAQVAGISSVGTAVTAVAPAAAPTAALAAAPPPAQPPSSYPDLTKAVVLRIGYTVNNKPKVLTLNEAGEVRAVLASLTITGEEKKIDVRFFPLGTVDFQLPDQKEIRAKLVAPTQLELENWGQIYVRDDFYEKICAIVSKAEGKPADVLKNNRW